MIDVAQVPKWLVLDAVGHVLASRANWWNHALCGLSTPGGEVTQDEPPRICRACRAALTNREGADALTPREEDDRG